MLVHVMGGSERVSDAGHYPAFLLFVAERRLQARPQLGSKDGVLLLYLHGDEDKDNSMAMTMTVVAKLMTGADRFIQERRRAWRAWRGHIGQGMTSERHLIWSLSRKRIPTNQALVLKSNHNCSITQQVPACRCTAPTRKREKQFLWGCVTNGTANLVVLAEWKFLDLVLCLLTCHKTLWNYHALECQTVAPEEGFLEIAAVLKDNMR